MYILNNTHTRQCISKSYANFYNDNLSSKHGEMSDCFVPTYPESQYKHFEISSLTCMIDQSGSSSPFLGLHHESKLTIYLTEPHAMTSETFPKKRMAPLSLSTPVRRLIRPTKSVIAGVRASRLICIPGDHK